MASLAPAQQATTESGRGRGRAERRLGWQGFGLRMPEDWDLTGYSGSFHDGYFRADDSESLGIEVKWATESKRARREPKPTGARGSLEEGSLNSGSPA